MRVCQSAHGSFVLCSLTVKDLSVMDDCNKKQGLMFVNMWAILHISLTLSDALCLSLSPTPFPVSHFLESIVVFSLCLSVCLFLSVSVSLIDNSFSRFLTVQR